MIIKKMNKFISADGFEIKAGDTVYIKKYEDKEEYEQKKVAEIVSNEKLKYDTPCSKGYIGARYTIVYKQIT